jgi:thymidylate kinase
MLVNHPTLPDLNTQAKLSGGHVTEESAGLLADLLQEKVRFAHWKGNTHLQASLTGKTDIDILVHPADRLLYEKVIRKRSYKKLNTQPWNVYPALEDWLGFDNATGTLLHLHTHYDLVSGITYGKYLQLPWLDQFFKHLKFDKHTGWPIPTPELETIVLLVRIQANALFKKPGIPGGKQNELRTLLSQVQMHLFRDLCRELELNVPESFDSDINRTLKESNVPAMLHLSSFFYQQVSNCVKNKWRLNTLKTFYYKHFLKKARYISQLTGPLQLKKTVTGGGKIFALVGSDGSGKSTICNELVKWLTFKIDTHYFYFGKRPNIKSYDHSLFSPTGFLFNNAFISRYCRKLAGGFFYVLLISKKISMLRLAKGLSKKSSLVICDRFPQQNVTGFFDGPKLRKGKGGWLSKLEKRQFNKFCMAGADLVFRLNISPEVAARRKTDHDHKMIEQKCIHLSRLTFGNAKVIDVDAEMPLEQVLLNIKRKIWENI